MNEPSNAPSRRPRPRRRRPAKGQATGPATGPSTGTATGTSSSTQTRKGPNRPPRPKTPRPFSVDQLERRRASIPPLNYPESLPVVTRREDLLAALRDHQVVVVAGETGSGKTTQLPKLCLELGRGVAGTIGHTQPRRIAARAVAERLAEELGTEVGANDGVVTYKVRFTERGTARPLIKVMTDGVLLAEIHSDPLLQRYDTLIIDEAHERSLTIDFLLGYLPSILPRRPDLKVIITSATIDPQRFAAHFAVDDVPAPVVEVSGRTYPVEIRYRPVEDDVDQPAAICAALAELGTEIPGDVLVFLSGEREIKDAEDAVQRFIAETPRWRGTEVVPLYGRLSAAEQHRVFDQHKSRRVVLATNVAETSLTVPGIRYVIDPGTARISRYSNRLKVQRLPIEPISQASANQRAGRCGRVADGICIRLYSEEEFDARSRFTDPEVLRTHLSSVILRMASLDLGGVADFGFIDPPDPRAIKDGINLLVELGALTESPGRGTPPLTPVGRTMARLPLDPRLARMVVAADGAGVLEDVLVLAAALTIQDPRESPGDRGSGERQAADTQHARFTDETSDFMSWLNLWDHVESAQRDRSGSSFRRMCRNEHLHYLRVREWQDLVAQLRSICTDLGFASQRRELRDDQRRDAIHRSLLPGLLSHIGLKTADRKDYLGARGARFAISPGSALFKKPPTWVMAGELVETTRLWGNHCTRIEPEWIESVAEHLIVRQHSEPRWSKNRGSAVATERVTLFGIPIVAARTVPLGPIDPPTARDLFVRHGLVAGEWRAPTQSPMFTFWRHNRDALERVSDVEDRVRQRGIAIDEESMAEWYSARIPDSIVSLAHFEQWWRKERQSNGTLLTMTDSDLVSEVDGVDDVDAAFPVRWSSGEFSGDLDYLFDPTAEDDGVTATVALQALPAFDPDALAPATSTRRVEIITDLIRSLPKPLRRAVVPAPDVARSVEPELDRDAPLTQSLARALRARTGLDIRAEDFDPSRISPHLVPTIRVVDETGAEIARGKDLDALRTTVQPQLRKVLAAATTSIEVAGLREWPAAPIPQSVPIETVAGSVTGYPALVDSGDGVDLRVLESRASQQAAHRDGVRRLLLLRLPSPIKSSVARLDRASALTLARTPYTSVPEMLTALSVAIIDSFLSGDLPWSQDEFDTLVDTIRSQQADLMDEGIAVLARVLTADATFTSLLDRTSATKPLADALEDLRLQHERLVHAHFVTVVGWPRLRELPRYLTAMEQRLSRIGGRIDRDRADLLMVQQLEDEWVRVAGGAPLTAPPTADLAAIRWMLEELRVSVFASTVKAKGPVSETRVLKALAAID